MIAMVCIEAGVLAQLIYAAWLLPGLFGPHRPFGAKQPATSVAVSSINRILRRYRVQILAAGCLVTATTIAVTVSQAASVPQTTTGATAAFAVFLLFGLIAYCRARRDAAAIANDETPSFAEPNGAQHADVSRTGRFPLRWAAAVATVPMVTGAIGAVRYRHLPAMLATGWNAAGDADRFTPTSLETVDGFVTLQIIAAVTVLVLCEGGWSASSTQRRPAPPVDYRAVRRVLVTAVGAQVILCLGSLILWRLLTPTAGTTAIIALVALAVAVLATRDRAAGKPGQTSEPARRAQAVVMPAESGPSLQGSESVRPNQPAARSDRGSPTGSEAT